MWTRKKSFVVSVQVKEKKKDLEWFLTWPYLCCVTDDEMTWKMRDRQRKTEIWRSKEKRKKENKTKIGDTEKEAETIRRMLSLHHYFNTHSPSTDSSSSFFIIRSPSHLFFVLFILSLPVSIISFYLSVSLIFCCSDTQTNEPWNIRHRDTERVVWECVYVCVGGRLCTCTCMCVCVCSFWLWLWRLPGLLAVLEGSPPVFDLTFVIQKIIWQAQNQIGC